jgi:hypothetical protein
LKSSLPKGSCCVTTRQNLEHSSIWAITTLGETLGIHIMCEGVEHTDQLERVLDDGRTLVQGISFQKNAPAAELTEIVSRWRSDTKRERDDQRPERNKRFRQQSISRHSYQAEARLSIFAALLCWRCFLGGTSRPLEPAAVPASVAKTGTNAGADDNGCLLPVLRQDAATNRGISVCPGLRAAVH